MSEGWDDLWTLIFPGAHSKSSARFPSLDVLSNHACAAVITCAAAHSDIAVCFKNQNVSVFLT